MKYQALFSLNDKTEIINVSSAAIVFGTLRVYKFIMPPPIRRIAEGH